MRIPCGRHFRVIAFTFVSPLLASCYTWVPVPPTSVMRIIEDRELGLAVIGTEAGVEYEVRSPWVRGDSIVWVDREGHGSVAFADVRYVDRYKLEAGKTIGLVAVIGAGAFVTLFALAWGGAG